jgi:hypothetical protein
MFLWVSKLKPGVVGSVVVEVEFSTSGILLLTTFILIDACSIAITATLEPCLLAGSLSQHKVFYRSFCQEEDVQE